MSYTVGTSPITTPDDVSSYAKRRYLNFDYTVRYQDTVLTEMILAAQTEIESITGHIFNAQSVKEEWHGEEINGGTLLQAHYPILLEDSEGTSLPVTLTVNGVELTLNTDYYITDSRIGNIKTENHLPSSGYNNVVLEYTGGYIPSHPMAKALCEAMVVYTMYLERETPPSLQTIVQDVSDEGTTKVDRADKILPVVFDIQERFRKLPRRLFLGILEV